MSDDENTFERISRFQTVQAGHFWRALNAIPEENISENEVLLIESIRWVDGDLHTIILRTHPDKYGRTLYVNVDDSDGNPKRTFFSKKEHRFLVDDFVARFEYEPDFERVRQQELEKLQQRISSLQTELIETQTNPTKMQDIALLTLATEEAKTASSPTSTPIALPKPAGTVAEADQSKSVAAAEPSQAIVSLATGSLSNAIRAGVTVDTVALMQAAADREYKIASAKANWIQSKTTEIAETVRAMTPYFEERAAVALAQTEDVRDYVKKLRDGIASLDLYVGKDVVVNRIREGKSAPAGEPLTFVQMKLVMEEELAIFVDVDESFDFTNHDQFFEALNEHDALVRQIFPTERCMLVMATRRYDLEYSGDAYSNAMKNRENRLVFMLVRDGENIFQIYSPVESHLGTHNLFPSQDEQNAIFRGFDGTKIKFDDVTFTDHKRRHDSFALHYKRFLILVCGLDHREKLFGDFYSGPQTMDFLSMEFQNQFCRFIFDEGNVLTDGRRPDLQTWISQKNAYLRSGSRVLCQWLSVMTPKSAPSIFGRWTTRSGERERIFDPSRSVDIVVAARRGTDIVVETKVSGYSVNLGRQRDFMCRVTLMEANQRSDYLWPGFLCLDTVTVDDLTHYIHSRRARKNHVAFVRMFKMAIKHLQSEAREQADTLAKLRAALDEGNVGDPSQRDDIIAQAVTAWRAKNRGALLPKFEGTPSGRDWTSLLDQTYMLANSTSAQVDDVERFVLDTLGLRPLRLVLNGAAKQVVYATAKPEDMDNRFERHVWVHAIELDRDKTGLFEKARRWLLLADKSASETTIFEWEEAKDWRGKSSRFKSHAHKQSVFDAISARLDVKVELSLKMNDSEISGALRRWEAAHRTLNETTTTIIRPEFLLPIGLMSRRGEEIKLVCVGTRVPIELMYALAKDGQTKQGILSVASEIYMHKKKRQEAIKEKAEMLVENGCLTAFRFFEVSLDYLKFADLAYTNEAMGYTSYAMDAVPSYAMDLKEAWRLVSGDDRYFVHTFDPKVLNEEGKLRIDEMLGIELPSDYKLFRVRFLVFSKRFGDNDGQVSFVDIGPFDHPNFKPVDHLQRDSYDEIKWEGMSSRQMSSAVETSHAMAMRSVDRAAAEKRKVAVSSRDLPDLLQPAEGIERWYFMPKKDSVPSEEVE